MKTDRKSFKFFYLISLRRQIEKMENFSSKNMALIQPSVVKETEIIVQHWIRKLKIRLGWINDFDKLVVNYVTTIFMLDIFCLSSKLLKTFYGHANAVWSIDYSTFNDDQLLCSGSIDNTVRVWNIKTNEQIQLFNKHSSFVYCAKFSSYHHYNNHQNVICSSSNDKTIRFWDVKNNQQLQMFDEHINCVVGIEFSQFNGGRYLCSGSGDRTIRLWDVKTYTPLHIFNGHTNIVWCIDISPLQNNNSNNNKSNHIGIIGGNGYTICSGSFDKTIRIWDIETAKQSIKLKGHENWIRSVKYGSNELRNTILSGSDDKSVRLWDIQSGKQIEIFNGHTMWVSTVEYSPFVVKNIEIGNNSNVICSGSMDNTIYFWDIRSNKKELFVINGDEKRDDGICCLKFLQLKKRNNDRDYNINLCFGSGDGPIRIWE
ncbi:hypothetical protein RFI_28093 [Reticulomyxa filosa]|uniref:Uncharacterized protein n=1 Tax=Reticulomyxa filosa TaxID=46433 RepID=X6M746_RETFI|nr:hypothetical protein RFI_28093 [Reticulomyxa filosa]|eukprot:ETO09292.1 hypothetical protein RFI_28093 [Reticulomyxa filosa]